jgi:hypothetical protein
LETKWQCSTPNKPKLMGNRKFSEKIYFQVADALIADLPINQVPLKPSKSVGVVAHRTPRFSADHKFSNCFDSKPFS